MKHYLLLFLAILLLQCSNENTIVNQGNAVYGIYLADTTDSATQTAASILQEYVKKISGAKLAIQQSIIPGKTIILTSNIDDLHPDGFIIQTDTDNNLLLSGGSDQGVIYAVTTLLEKYLGCRKFSPREEYIPSLSTIQLPAIHIKEEPTANFRCVNGLFARDEGYRHWRRTDNIPDMFAAGYFVHTFDDLMPWEDYFHSHPDYYSYATGKRLKDQLCLSNPKVYDIVKNKLKEEMAKQPNETVWSVSQNDNFTYCRCPDCQQIIDEEGSPSGPIIRFINRLAREFPNKVISTLAYQFSRHAPKKTKPEENVQVMLCTIELNRSKPIATDPSSQSFVKDIQDWNKISDRIFLWDYTVDFHHQLAPFPNLHVLQPNLQLFLNNDAYDLFQQTNTGYGHEFSELKAYLISNLMWNPDVNVDSLKQDFISHYYGDAAPWITKYINHLEEALIKSDVSMGIYDHPVKMQNSVMSPENTAQYIRYFDQAEKSVINKNPFLDRVKVARLSIQYAIMEIGKNDMFGPRGWYKKDDNQYILNQEMAQRLENFYTIAMDNKISVIDEMGTTATDYYQSTKHFIDVQVQGNHAFKKPVTCHPVPSPKYSDGDAQTLTNGVQGAGDYKVHWLGWEAQNFSVTLDLEKSVSANSITLNSLYFPKSWILHPKQVSCYVSNDNDHFAKIGQKKIPGDQRDEAQIHSFEFKPSEEPIRYVKFKIKGTLALPNWHPSAGGKSWVFLDEIIVK